MTLPSTNCALDEQYPGWQEKLLNYIFVEAPGDQMVSDGMEYLIENGLIPSYEEIDWHLDNTECCSYWKSLRDAKRSNNA